MSAALVPVQVVLGRGVPPTNLAVDPNKQMIDLFVQLAAQQHLSPTDHTMLVHQKGRKVEYKASQTVGSLGPCTIFLASKENKKISMRVGSSSDGDIPFEKTQRLTVKLPHNQKTVCRVNHQLPISAVFQQICRERNLSPNNYQARHPHSPDQKLDLSKSLSELGLVELSVVSIVLDTPQQDVSFGKPSSSTSTYTDALPTYMPGMKKEKKRGILSFFSRKKGFKVSDMSLDDSTATRLPNDRTTAIPSSSSSSMTLAKDAVVINALPTITTANNSTSDRQVAPPRKKRMAPPPPPLSASPNSHSRASSHSSGFDETSSSPLESPGNCSRDSILLTSSSQETPSSESSLERIEKTVVRKKRRAPPPPPLSRPVEEDDEIPPALPDSPPPPPPSTEKADELDVDPMLLAEEDIPINNGDSSIEQQSDWRGPAEFIAPPPPSSPPPPQSPRSADGGDRLELATSCPFSNDDVPESQAHLAAADDDEAADLTLSSTLEPFNEILEATEPASTSAVAGTSAPDDETADLETYSQHRTPEIILHSEEVNYVEPRNPDRRELNHSSARPVVLHVSSVTLSDDDDDLSQPDAALASTSAPSTPTAASATEQDSSSSCRDSLECEEDQLAVNDYRIASLVKEEEIDFSFRGISGKDEGRGRSDERASKSGKTEQKFTSLRQAYKKPTHAVILDSTDCGNVDRTIFESHAKVSLTHSDADVDDSVFCPIPSDTVVTSMVTTVTPLKDEPRASVMYSPIKPVIKAKSTNFWGPRPYGQPRATRSRSELSVKDVRTALALHSAQQDSRDDGFVKYNGEVGSNETEDNCEPPGSPETKSLLMIQRTPIVSESAATPPASAASRVSSREKTKQELQAQYEELKKQFSRWQSQIVQNQQLLTSSSNAAVRDAGDRTVDSISVRKQGSPPPNVLLTSPSKRPSGDRRCASDQLSRSHNSLIDTPSHAFAFMNGKPAMSSTPTPPPPPPQPQSIPAWQGVLKKSGPQRTFSAPALSPREELMLAIRNARGGANLRSALE